MPGTQHIIQTAYVVNDLDHAIERWHGLWGIGPFFVRRHMQFASVTYRGAPGSLDQSVAYVQAGDTMVEFICPHGDAPNAFRDVFAPGEEGLHHIAMSQPEDYAAMLAHYTGKGFPVAMEVRTLAGRGAAFIDTRPMLGHMTEIYVPSEGLTNLYREVAAGAANWDHKQLKIEVDPTK